MSYSKTTTQYCVYGKKADGTWKAFGVLNHTKEDAEKHIAAYKFNSEMYPKNYAQYNGYKIAKRTVITTYSEWEDEM